MRKIFTLCLGTMFALSTLAETIQITMSSTTSDVRFSDNTSGAGYWELTADSDDYFVFLSAYSAQAAGTYSIDDLLAGESYIGDYTSYQEVALTGGSVTISISGKTTKATGSLTGNDGNTYVLDLTVTEPEVSETVNLTLTGEIDDTTESDQLLFITGYDTLNNTELGLMLKATSVVGTFTEANLLYPLFIVEEVTQHIYSATIVVVQNADGSYTVTADILCYNNTLYHVIITIPASQGIEDIVLTEKAQKVVVDGMLYIVRDGKMFNIQGAQVR